MNHRKSYNHDIYKKISHAQRIGVIYAHFIHLEPMRKMSREVGISYNSIRNIVNAYKNYGRTNKKSTKSILLH